MAASGQERETERKTLRLQVDGQRLDGPASQAALAHAAELLRGGGLVAFPTETVYGLGANALDAQAVAGIFAAKERPGWDPLIVHVTDEERLRRVVAEVPPPARVLMDLFWPGPLTLLLPRAPGVPPAVTAGRPRIAVRMPRHPVARRLLTLAGVPVAAPSANRFGRTSPTRAEWVLDDLEGRIDAVVDSGETTFGLESTVVDACAEPMVLYRPGVVTLEELRALVPDIIAYQEIGESPGDAEARPSPGIGLRHYAPRARLVLVEPARGDTCAEACAREHATGERVGLMRAEHLKGVPEDVELVYRWGDWDDMAELGRRLFAGLRELDARGATVIVCPVPEETGVGVAICDRLRRAGQAALRPGPRA